MPSASELEEFGLEVEHEHHALILPSGEDVPSNDDDDDASSSNSLSYPRRHHHRPPVVPSREQRRLLNHANDATHTSIPARFVRSLRTISGRLSVLTLSMLAFGVVLHLRRERLEADVVAVVSSSYSSSCVDDDVGLDAVLGLSSTESRTTCVDRVITSSSGSNRLHEEICDEILGGGGGGSDRKMIRDYCRRSCDVCEIDIIEDAMSEEEGGTATSISREEGGDGNEGGPGMTNSIEGDRPPHGDAKGKKSDEEEGEKEGDGKEHMDLVDEQQIEGTTGDDMPESKTKALPSSSLSEGEQMGDVAADEGGQKSPTSIPNDMVSIHGSDEDTDKAPPETESSPHGDDPPAVVEEKEEEEEGGASSTSHAGGNGGKKANLDDGIDEEGESGGPPRDASADKNDEIAESESKVKDSGSKTSKKNVDMLQK